MDFGHQMGEEDHQSRGPAMCHGHAGSVFVPSINTTTSAKAACFWPLCKRPRGRLHMRWWRDVIHKDIEELGFPKPSADEVFMWAQCGEEWICDTLANTD